jgi:hypothetical protein
MAQPNSFDAVTQDEKSKEDTSPPKARPIIAIAKKQREGGAAIRDKGGQSLKQPASPSRKPGAHAKRQPDSFVSCVDFANLISLQKWL